MCIFPPMVACNDVVLVRSAGRVFRTPAVKGRVHGLLLAIGLS